MSLFGRVRPVTAKQRRIWIFLWVEFGRYLSCAAMAAGILGLAAADPDSVPRAVVPVLVAAAVAVLCSAAGLSPLGALPERRGAR